MRKTSRYESNQNYLCSDTVCFDPLILINLSQLWRGTPVVLHITTGWLPLRAKYYTRTCFDLFHLGIIWTKLNPVSCWFWPVSCPWLQSRPQSCGCLMGEDQWAAALSEMRSNTLLMWQTLGSSQGRLSQSRWLCSITCQLQPEATLQFVELSSQCTLQAPKAKLKARYH